MTDSKTLNEIIANAEPQEDGHSFAVASNWTQGRTAFGGYTAAVLLAGVQKQHAELPPLRSAMINFTAPIAEAPTVTSDVMRQGRNITTVAAQAEVAGKLSARGIFTFGNGQQSGVSVDLPAPDVAEPEDLAELGKQVENAPGPGFVANFDKIPLAGDLPFSGSDKRVVRLWARHKDLAMREQLAGLLAIADFLPPAALQRVKGLAMSSSVNWMVNLLSAAPVTRDGWWLIESELSAGRDGYSSQVMRVWNSERELVIDGMQSVVIFEQS